MTRIVTYAHRTKRPPRKRAKAATLTVPGGSCALNFPAMGESRQLSLSEGGRPRPTKPRDRQATGCWRITLSGRC